MKNLFEKSNKTMFQNLVFNATHLDNFTRLVNNSVCKHGWLPYVDFIEKWTPYFVLFYLVSTVLLQSLHFLNRKLDRYIISRKIEGDNVVYETKKAYVMFRLFNTKVVYDPDFSFFLGSGELGSDGYPNKMRLNGEILPSYKIDMPSVSFYVTIDNIAKYWYEYMKNDFVKGTKLKNFPLKDVLMKEIKEETSIIYKSALILHNTIKFDSIYKIFGMIKNVIVPKFNLSLNEKYSKYGLKFSVDVESVCLNFCKKCNDLDRKFDKKSEPMKSFTVIFGKDFIDIIE